VIRLPIQVAGDLTISLGGSSAVALSPAQGLRLAEQLIRKSTRRMMVEEAFAPPRQRPHVATTPCSIAVSGDGRSPNRRKSH
jgi:hypothetical protein